MSIEMDGKPFTFAGVTSEIRYKKQGLNTVAVLARIQARKTKGRDNPPGCCNGFITEGLPFAKGHVVALELGGSDDTRNIVPQFGLWQGTGAWRDVELALLKHAGCVMLVEVTYGRTGANQSYDKLFEAFNDDALMDWDHPLIPSAFVVKAFKSTLDFSSIKPSASDKAFDEAVDLLQTSTPAFSEQFQLGHSMPDEDRDYWIRNAAAGLIEGLHLKQGSGKHGTLTPVTYMLTGTGVKALRKALPGVVPSITATETQGLQICGVIKQYCGFTPTQLKRKHKARTEENVSLLPLSDLGVPSPGKKAKLTK